MDKFVPLNVNGDSILIRLDLIGVVVCVRTENSYTPKWAKSKIYYKEQIYDPSVASRCAFKNYVYVDQDPKEIYDLIEQCNKRNSGDK